MPSITMRTLPAQEAVSTVDRVWPLYDAVFADWDSRVAWRDQMFLRHAERPEFRLILAESGSEPVGFAWGYVGERGQFWSDWVAREMPAVAQEWVGGHDELVCIGVLPGARGRGLGQRLLDAYLAEARERTLLGTETDPESPAVRLYRSRGFTHLGLLSPDVQVMGRRP